MMRADDWEQVRRWRIARRAELRSSRLSLQRDEKRRVRMAVTDLIRQNAPGLSKAIVGFYWPFKGEIDLRTLVQGFVEGGGRASLPVVVDKHRPLQFWSWGPHTKMRRGVWNIPVPAERDVVHPTALLVPLLGFDEAGYRLGYGGGYYDRTLQAMVPRPLTIGVGYELGRLETIYPQPHDIPLDAIVTEAGFARCRRRGEPSHADCGLVLTPVKESGRCRR